MLKILLFLVQTALDDGSTGQESLLQASEGFVLNLNSSFFFEGLYVVETALFKDRKERIVDLLLGCVILFILLALLHLVTSLSIDRLLQDSNEDVLGVLRTTLLINCLLAFISQHELCLHLSLLTVGLCVAGHLQFVILLFNLLLLGLFLVFIVDIVDVGVSNEIITVPFFVARRDLTLLVMVVDEDLLHGDIKLSLLDLVGGRQVWIQLELLSHLVDHNLSTIVIFLDFERLWGYQICIGSESHTAIDQFVRAILVFFNDLIFLVKELLSQNEAILLSVMVEVELSVAAIDTDHLLPVVVEQ